MVDELSLFELTSSSSSSPADCRYGIELSRAISHYDVPGRAQAWRMRIWVSNVYNVTANIFLFDRRTDGVTGDVMDSFIAVCSPVDLETYPTNKPNTGQEPAYYRCAEVDLISKNIELLNETWTLIKADRDELIRSLTYLCELTLDEVSPGGYLPEDEEPIIEPPTILSSSSTGPEVCPVDDYIGLRIVASDDPDFPVGTILVDDGGDPVPPGCTRQWTTDGILSDKTLVITTSLVYHQYVLVLDGVELDDGGIADGYRAIVNYTRGLGDDHTLQVEGVVTNPD